MKITKKTALAALGCAAAMLSGSAIAATTTLSGTQVKYTFDASNLGLFGTATLSGDTLVFAPAGFIATLDETQSYKSASETVTITVEALGGYQLAGFNLSEYGAYALGDEGSAWVAGSLQAIDVEGNTGKQLSSAITGSLGDAGTWTGAAAISLPATGWGGSDGIVKSVTLTLSNDLFALGSAEIQKGGASIASIAAPVPEAHTYAMLLAGLGLVGFMAQRKARSVI
jgi:hypothetical protein